MAISIQFYGIDDVINAVEKSKCSCWAIFQGRQFMFKSELPDLEESISLLKEILESLAENSSVYTIKLYESESGGRKIDEKTKCDAGSFNFKLTELEDLTQRREKYIMGRVERKSNYEDRMIQLEQKLDQLLTQGTPEPEDEEETLESAVIGLIQDPNKLLEFFNTLQQGQQMLFGKPASPTVGNPLRKVGQIQPGPSPAPAEISQNLSQPTEQDMQRLSVALDVLGRNDPKIVDHLEKLAILSQDKPATFNMAIKMLEGM